jgi:regulator of nonsense transcripts 3
MATSSRPPTNGLLPITASQTSGNASSNSRQSVAKPALSKLKIIVRRLPSGLTEAEFAATLGDAWEVGHGKVDWFLYKPGKDSTE